jgi:hypothetical protein
MLTNGLSLVDLAPAVSNSRMGEAQSILWNHRDGRLQAIPYHMPGGCVFGAYDAYPLAQT